MPRPAAPALRAAPAPIALAPRGVLVLLAPLLLAPLVLAAAARAEPMGRVSPVDGIVVRGTAVTDGAALGRALAADDDLLLLARPLSNRKLYLSALARKATLALERLGFAAPKVGASIEDDGAGGERIVVEAVEGRALVAGGVEIRGLPDDLAAGLRRWLQGQRPPEGALPVVVETDGGWGGERWIDADGARVHLEPPLWEPGKPAPCDAPYLATIRRAIGRFLRDHGHHASARLVDAPRPSGLLGGLAGIAAAARRGSEAPRGSLEVAVRPAAEGGTATLVVTGSDLPARPVLRDVAVAGPTRTGVDALVSGLGIRLGGPVTERELVAWRRALHDSGRFVSSRVTLEEAPAQADGPPGLVARFDLDDYPPATPFGTPPSREEEVMLRFRAWVAGSLAGEADLVATWRPDAAPGTGGTAVDLVLARSRGLLLTAAAGGDGPCGIAVGRDGLGWFLPGGAGRYEMPLPRDGRMTVQVGLSLGRKPPAKETDAPVFERRLAAGVGFESRSREADGPFGIRLDVDPVACVSLVHEHSPALSWEGEELVVAVDGMTARFDGPTGRLMALSTAGSTLRLASAAGRLESDLATLRAGAGLDRAEASAPVSSAVAFFTAPDTAAALGRVGQATGIASPLAAPLGHGGPLLEALRRAGERGALEGADRLVAAWMAGPADDGEPLPTIPHDKPSATDGLMLAGRIAASQAWRILERDCGRTSWPAALSRLAMLGLAQDPAALEELSAFMTSPDTGPLAFLAAATGVPMPLVSVTLARRGEERLTAEAFRADCRPLEALLAAHDLALPLAAVLRTLTDAEREALGRSLAGDPAFLAAPLAVLRAAPSDAAAAAALPDALDAWWEAGLRRLVAARLAESIAPRTAGAPADGQPVR